MNEEEAAQYLDLPVHIVRRLAEKGYIRSTSRTKLRETEKESSVYKRSVPNNPFLKQSNTNFTFSEDDLKDFDEHRKQRVEEREKQEFEFSHTRRDLILVTVKANKFDRNSKPITEQVIVTFEGYSGSAKDAKKEALELTLTDGLPVTAGWRNHEADVYEFTFWEKDM